MLYLLKRDLKTKKKTTYCLLFQVPNQNGETATEEKENPMRKETTNKHWRNDVTVKVKNKTLLKLSNKRVP